MSVDFERKIVPGVILVSVSLDVVAMCSGGWLLGYWGDIVVLRVSPWSACKLRCLYCADERPTFDCFPIQGSLANSNFDLYALVGHLQYWTVALEGVGMVTSLMSCFYDTFRFRAIPMKCTKPTLILLFAATILSTVIVSIIGAKINSLPPEDLSGAFDDVRYFVGWPYALRLTSLALTLFISLPSVVYKLCRHQIILLHLQRNSTSSSSFNEPIIEEHCTVVSSSSARDELVYDADSVDEIENGSLL